MITNNAGLPEPVYRAVCNDQYERGKSDYTTTELIAPPRIVSLRRKHRENITEDAVDRLFSLSGQLMHLLFERSSMGDDLVEKRLYIEREGKIIGGQVDVLRDTTLFDYKETKVIRLHKPKDDWIHQANINRLLCVENGYEIEYIEYWAKYRDWSVITAARDSSYPPAMEKFDIPLWPLAQTEQYIRDRIAAHEAAKNNPPVCSMDERWQSPDKYALMKKGQKRAVKLYDSLDEAESAMKPGMYIEPRTGEPKRCLYYCSVSPFCDWFRNYAQEAMNK